MTSPLIEFELWLSGPVVSWQRNRISRTGRQFRDSKGMDYRRMLAESIRLTYRGQLRAPVRVEVLVVYPRNKTRPAIVPKEVWATGRRVLRPTSGRDDIDRLQGNIYDSLKDAGAIGDDGHIVWAEVRKVWASEGETPGLWLRVMECDWEPSGGKWPDMSDPVR